MLEKGENAASGFAQHSQHSEMRTEQKTCLIELEISDQSRRGSGGQGNRRTTLRSLAFKLLMKKVRPLDKKNEEFQDHPH